MRVRECACVKCLTRFFFPDIQVTGELGVPVCDTPFSSINQVAVASIARENKEHGEIRAKDRT